VNTMMRTIVAEAILALGTAGAGVSLADPGPGNGHNGWGLCNAYSHNGGNNHGRAFQALEDQANQAYPDAESTADAVAQFCAQPENQKPGNGGKG
jgi:hypothetical protein